MNVLYFGLASIGLRTFPPSTYAHMLFRISGGRRSSGESWLLLTLRSTVSSICVTARKFHLHRLFIALGLYVEHSIPELVITTRGSLDNSITALLGVRCLDRRILMGSGGLAGRHDSYRS